MDGIKAYIGGRLGQGRRCSARTVIDADRFQHPRHDPATIQGEYARGECGTAGELDTQRTVGFRKRLRCIQLPGLEIGGEPRAGGAGSVTCRGQGGVGEVQKSGECGQRVSAVRSMRLV